MDNNNNQITKCDPIDCSTCGSDCSSRMDLSDRVVNITTDEGEEKACLIILKFVMDEKDYIAVMPLKDNPECDIYLFRMINEKTMLENIDDMDEYNRAAEVFGIEMEKKQKAEKK